ncbi:hypothetical protein L1887_01731 [Cichorium endivia]|nr:hypothetical protein L1887_01731 [Cichorium endivia]
MIKLHGPNVYLYVRGAWCYLNATFQSIKTLFLQKPKPSQICGGGKPPSALSIPSQRPNNFWGFLPCI